MSSQEANSLDAFRNPSLLPTPHMGLQVAITDRLPHQLINSY